MEIFVIERKVVQNNLKRIENEKDDNLYKKEKLKLDVEILNSVNVNNSRNDKRDGDNRLCLNTVVLGVILHGTIPVAKQRKNG